MKMVKKVLLFVSLLVSHFAFSQNPENWTKEQLEEPAHLAKTIEAGKHVPLLISVGPGASIPNSVVIGSVKDSANLTKLSTYLQAANKDSALIIYCGCCPFEHCPNVRPAIALLKERGFTNYKLLNIPHNIKADWIDKGYPTVTFK